MENFIFCAVKEQEKIRVTISSFINKERVAVWFKPLEILRSKIIPVQLNCAFKVL